MIEKMFPDVGRNVLIKRWIVLATRLFFCVSSFVSCCSVESISLYIFLVLWPLWWEIVNDLHLGFHKLAIIYILINSKYIKIQPIDHKYEKMSTNLKFKIYDNLKKCNFLDLLFSSPINPGDMMDTQQQQQYQIQGQTNIQTNQRAGGMMNNPMNTPMNRPMLNKPMGGYGNNGVGMGGPGGGPNMNNYMAAQQRGFMGQQGKQIDLF